MIALVAAGVYAGDFAIVAAVDYFLVPISLDKSEYTADVAFSFDTTCVGTIACHFVVFAVREVAEMTNNASYCVSLGKFS